MVVDGRYNDAIDNYETDSGITLILNRQIFSKIS